MTFGTPTSREEREHFLKAYIEGYMRELRPGISSLRPGLKLNYEDVRDPLHQANFKNFAHVCDAANDNYRENIGPEDLEKKED
jgi:hypothetical protein